MLCLKSAQASPDLPAFIVPIPDDLYDSIVGRRVFFIKVLKDIARHFDKSVFPLVLECNKGCRAVIDSPDSVPIDDVRCAHGLLLRFDHLADS